MGALATCAAIMGPSTCVQVRDIYQEPTNIFAICVGYPGSGKSQAFRMTTREPLNRQLEGCAERQLYCRLYDGGQWTSSTG